MRIVTRGICPDGKIIENRAYGTWSDATRARTQLQRRGARCVSYLDVVGPALHVVQPSSLKRVHGS